MTQLYITILDQHMQTECVHNIPQIDSDHMLCVPWASLHGDNQICRLPARQKNNNKTTAYD